MTTPVLSVRNPKVAFVTRRGSIKAGVIGMAMLMSGSALAQAFGAHPECVWQRLVSYQAFIRACPMHRSTKSHQEIEEAVDLLRAGIVAEGRTSTETLDEAERLTTMEALRFASAPGCSERHAWFFISVGKRLEDMPPGGIKAAARESLATLYDQRRGPCG